MLSRSNLAVALLIAALPATAQDRGGVRPQDPMLELAMIEANRGCPMSTTSVTVGVNRAIGHASSSQQHIATQGASTAGCQPLVSTQVVAGVNLALGSGSSASQTVTATGQRGLLATTSFTRGANIAYGAGSSAGQRLGNLTSR